MMGNGFVFTIGHGASWLFWILLIVLFVWLYNVFISRQDDKNSPKKTRTIYQTPLEILEQRFAEGEIDIEEYKRRKSELEKNVMP